MATLNKGHDQVMVVAAFRYCIGRRSYIIGICIEWIEQHWLQFTDSTRKIILRDLVCDVHNDIAGDSIDKDAWLSMFRRCLVGMTSEEIEGLYQMVAWKIDRETWEEYTDVYK